MYQSLYKKYRPRTFSSIVGQEKVVEILKNQIEQNKIGHAYLFTGVRGTGKTSIAKIMAQAMNCENLQNGNPCNSCETCKSILEARNSDIIEMDAASNNGVDDIRSIKDEISFLPTLSKYRVYIIDEVHMLSTGAFNALLKTLEEPPIHVKFILATTEPQKLPATIISRCQRFEFTKIDNNKLYELLKKISNDVNIDIEDNSLRLISMLARGSARDSISILESVSNIDGKITVDDVRKIVGIPNANITITLFENIIKANSQKVLEDINFLLSDGKEPVNILTEILAVISSVYMQSDDLISVYNQEELNIIKKYFELDKIELYKIIKEFIDLISELKFIDNKNVLLVAGLINITEKCKENEYIKKSLQRILNIKGLDQVFQDNTTKNLEIKEEKVEPVHKIQDKSQGEIQENKNIVENNLENSINTLDTLNSIKTIDEKIENIDKELEKIDEKNTNLSNINNLEQKEEIKSNNELENVTVKVIDTIMFRKELLQSKKMPMFVALNNARIILENNILKIDLSKETNMNNLTILNSNESLEILEKIGEKILKQKVKVEYIF